MEENYRYIVYVGNEDTGFYSSHFSIKEANRIEDIVAIFKSEEKAKGCDGIIIYNVVDGNMRKANEYIVFSPNQVKLVYDNNVDYSLVSDNMYECIKK